MKGFLGPARKSTDGSLPYSTADRLLNAEEIFLTIQSRVIMSRSPENQLLLQNYFRLRKATWIIFTLWLTSCLATALTFRFLGNDDRRWAEVLCWTGFALTMLLTLCTYGLAFLVRRWKCPYCGCREKSSADFSCVKCGFTFPTRKAS